MLKILKNLKQSWLSVLTIVALLCVQAAVDLELPNYTSKIVNTGIQAGGIEYAVPETISSKDMEAILLFSNDDDKILENYTTEESDGNYVIKDLKENEKEPEKVKEELKKQAIERYEQKEKDVGDQMRELERVILLKVVDEKWMNHIDGMEELKDGIGLRAYGQQDPVVKYRMEGMDMFEEMISNIKFDVVKILMHIRSSQGEVKRQEAAKITGAALEAINSVDGGEKMNVKENQTVRNEGPKVGRNDPCPCGSGKKYKNCCGKNA